VRCVVDQQIVKTEKRAANERKKRKPKKKYYFLSEYDELVWMVSEKSAMKWQFSLSHEHIACASPLVAITETCVGENYLIKILSDGRIFFGIYDLLKNRGVETLKLS
jgi:hypothetical protein